MPQLQFPLHRFVYTRVELTKITQHTVKAEHLTYYGYLLFWMYKVSEYLCFV